MRKADGLGGIPPLFMPEDMGGPKGYRTFRPLLEPAKVRYVGDRVAFVVAGTPEQARIAAERVEVDYEPLPAAVSVEDAAREGAPKVWDDNAAGNLAFPLMMGNKEATEAAFAKAKHTASVRLYNNRISANAMEPRAAIGDFSNDSFTLYTSSQNPHGARSILAGAIFKIPETRLRVISPDVGGGFGMKGDIYPEDGLVLWASRKLGRPVKWVATRTESLLGDNHGRDQLISAEMALDENGKILAVRAQALHAVGAYVTNAGVVPVLCALRNIPNVYVVPAMLVASKATFTHTTPLGPYRGAGRPEASYVIERLMDEAARKLDHRSGGAAPAQLHPAERHAVQHHRGLDRRRARSAGPTTPASSPGSPTAASRFPTGKTTRPGKRLRNRKASCAGARSSTTSRTPASSTSAWSCASIRAAWSPSSPARIPTARATPRPMRSSSPTGSACRSRASAWSRATPTRCRSAAAPTLRAAPCSAARP